MDASTPQDALRLLPSVDELLRHPRAEKLSGAGISRERVRELAQGALQELRQAIRGGALTGEALDDALGLESVVGRIEAAAARDAKRGLTRVINATGIVLHTGLGRAPVHAEVAKRMEEASRSYCTLEIDRESGERGQRDRRLGELLVRATGAEAGIAVNNCAGAVLLTLSTFAAGREAVTSRGELVEIGGSFRIPDVMKAANVKLVEVGTTNRTRIADYRNAVGEETGLLLKVHTSNFRVVGFTEEVSDKELGELGSELGIRTAYDLGSGLLESEAAPRLDFLEGESSVAQAVASGVDVVMFSGDKLLGGPQAGMIVGKQGAIDALRKNPIYRAVRLDKAALAGLEATFEMVLAGRANELPTYAMLSKSEKEVERDADDLCEAINAIDGFTAEVFESASQPGSGSAPGVEIPSRAVVVSHAKMSAAELATKLRMGDPCVFSRIQDGRVWLDPRTLLEGDLEGLVEAVRGGER